MGKKDGTRWNRLTTSNSGQVLTQMTFYKKQTWQMLIQRHSHQCSDHINVKR
uniref:Uncharacterized protein n=1 Tax=Arion vulgaris TaxID=1028688 RepID=A0A0B6Z2V6_9EUPU